MGQSIHDTLAPFPRYHGRVFLTPPRPEIYVTDPDRPHGLAEAVAEDERLVGAYKAMGYEVKALPKVGGEERVRLVVRGSGAK